MGQTKTKIIEQFEVFMMQGALEHKLVELIDGTIQSVEGISSHCYWGDCFEQKLSVRKLYYEVSNVIMKFPRTNSVFLYVIYPCTDENNV